MVWAKVGAVCIALGAVSAVLYPVCAHLLRRAAQHRQREMKVAIDTAVAAASVAAATTAEAINRRLIRIESQFGENGGGLRERVNTIGEDVAGISSQMSGFNDRFLDHLRQSSDDRSRLAVLETALLNRGVNG